MATGITPIEQQDFSGGMNLGVKQDAPFEQKAVNSAHWLENFNPNLIQGEIHTRKGSRIEPGNAGICPLTSGAELVGALEMSHSAAQENPGPNEQPLGFARHVLGSSGATIQTYGPETAWEAGVWSSGGEFNKRVSDYDVYGESLLLVANDPAAIADDKAKLVYAYTFKDAAVVFGQSNDDGHYLLNGIEDRPPATNRRWEVLDVGSFADIAEAFFETVNIPEDEEFGTATVEAPKINGQTIKFATEGHVDLDGDPPYGGTHQVKISEFQYRVKSGKSNLDIKALTWGALLKGPEGTIENPTPREQSYGAGVYGYVMNDNTVPLGWTPLTNKLTEGSEYTGALVSSDFPAGERDGKPFPVQWLIQDYVKKEKPRCFFDIERIPYVITMIVNGIERMIKKDEFLVSEDEAINDPFLGGFTEAELRYQDTEDPQVPDTYNYYQILTSIPYQKPKKRVRFNIRLKIDKLEAIPVGLTEIRLYIANKSKVGDKFFSVARPLEDTTKREEGEDYNGWTEVPDGLFNNPETDDQQYGYSLVKSFVVYGDPSLYKRKEIDVNHMNYGVENIYVNEWVDDGIGGFMGKWEDEGGETRSEFWLWDYMNYTAEPLASNIQGALVEYKGKGAATIANLKGVSFVAGCLDKDGNLEPGIIRKSLLQGAVQSTDVFSEVDFLKVGNETHTALVQFREQLWAFSRSQIHRIQFRDISDIATAEVLDVYEGNGTFAPKTVCVTPYGVAWLSEAGVWISNGKEPELLSKPIEPLYFAIVLGKTFTLPNRTSIIFALNTMQIVYDPEHYEIVVSLRAEKSSYRDDPPNTPVKTDFRMVFSTLHKNWRIETYKIATHGEDFSIKQNYHKTHFARTSYKTAGIYTDELEPGSNMVWFNEHKLNLSTDTAVSITASLILHEIGDGVRDMQINRMITEAATPRGLTNPIENAVFNQPELYIYTADRAKQFVEAGPQYQTVPDGDTNDLLPPFRDNLVPYHVANQGEDYWINNRIDTPHENESVLSVPMVIQQTNIMTSQLHNVPFMRPVRRTYIEYVLKGWGRLRSIGMWLRIFERRLWG